MPHLKKLFKKGARAFRRSSRTPSPLGQNVFQGSQKVQAGFDSQTIQLCPDGQIAQSGDRVQTLQLTEDEAPQSKHVEYLSDNSMPPIVMPAELFQELVNATNDHIRLKALEQDGGNELEKLRPRLEAIEEEIPQLEDKVAEAEAKAISLREKLQLIETEKTRILQEKGEIQSTIKDKCQEFRHRTFDLFEIWQDIYQQEVPEGVPKGAMVANGEDSEPEVENDNEAPCFSPHRNDLPTPESGRINPPTRCDEESDARKYLLLEYSMLRRGLDQVEQNFENRHDRFEKEPFEAYERFQHKEPCHETELQMEHRHFRETQEMTRAIIDAEKELAEKKAELLQAGIQPPGSDIESGFLGDVGDGYRISGEVDAGVFEAPGTNPGILQWLRRIPGEPVSPQEPPIRPTEMDRWRAREMELWESSSMVAEGPQRRRIDTWRARAEATGANVDGPPPFAVPPRTSLRKWQAESSIGLAR